MSPVLAEFIGTAILVTFGNGVVANHLLRKNNGHNGGILFITVGWGFLRPISSTLRA